MPTNREMETSESHVVAGLFTDDPHWRRTTAISVLLGAVAGAGAQRANGPARLILGLAALVLWLPAISLALMIGIALLLRRLDRGPAEADHSGGVATAESGAGGPGAGAAPAKK
jgi:hypothetical protein